MSQKGPCVASHDSVSCLSDFSLQVCAALPSLRTAILTDFPGPTQALTGPQDLDVLFGEGTCMFSVLLCDAV